MTAGPIRTIDLNADIGEHDGDGYAADCALLDVVSSASIACGGHAGSADVMERTAREAMERGVAIGAHPSFPDREGFGRRQVSLGLDAIAASVRDQIDMLAECCLRAGAPVRYVKLHGALYNRAATDPALALVLAECIKGIDAGLVVLTLPASAIERASRAAALTTAREGFIDRAYMRDGTLAPRERDGAVLHDAESLAARAVTIALGKNVETIDGGSIEIDAQSLCVHGDSRNALGIVRLARARLEASGFSVRPFA